jgi:hypothetical protein
MLYEKCHERRAPLWVAAIDFKKAFDTVEHSAVWNALEEQKVPKQYMNTLKKLYEGQSGTIVANHESRPFGITRGTKQGDPISPPLFNAVLEKAMARVKGMWLKRGWGIQMGSLDGERLLNLRFADDILLVSRSLRVLKRMLEELQIAVREVGLELHFGKTKILANEQGRKQSHATSIELGGGKVDILPPGECTQYLGRVFSFMDFHTHEIKHRIASG